MKKYLFDFIVFGVLFLVVITGTALAQTASSSLDIKYPVKELGNCANEKECKIYCDKTENIDECLSFAEKNNLMSKEEIKIARKFANKEMKGPGGCGEKDECDSYCNNIDNIDECVSFAEENNLMPEKELKEAKKIQAAIKKGIKPPSCKNKSECDIYCENPNNMEECISFGVEAGFIEGKELEDAQKMLSALKRGVKPLPCKGKDSCDEYCQNPDNIEMCVNFAIETGMMSEQEKEDSQKMLQAIKKGVKPPSCKGKEECDAYCGSEEHMEECINFSVAAGFMSEQEAEMAKKTGGKGPGGCKNKEECDAFCGNPDNQEICFQFGKENGMIPEGDLREIEQEKFQPMKDNVIRQEKEAIIPIDQTGPGGCKTKEECDAFCGSNPDECQKFQPISGIKNPGEQMMPQQAGPGGCKSPEECMSFCESNPEECRNFSPNIRKEGQQFDQFNQQGQQFNQFNQPNQLNQQQPLNNKEFQQEFQQQEEREQPQPMMAPQPEEQTQSRNNNVQKQSLLASALSAFLSLFR